MGRGSPGRKLAWLVIECNDAQESGYAGNSPLRLWRNLLSVNEGA